MIRNDQCAGIHRKRTPQGSPLGISPSHPPQQPTRQPLPHIQPPNQRPRRTTPRLPRHDSEGNDGVKAEHEERERQAILQALEATSWNKQAAAALLGLHRPTLYSKMRKHGIPQKRG